jgi:hypothetical protein
MRISGHTKNYVEITIPIEEVQAMLDCDEDTLKEFAVHLDKYCTWIGDCKKIRTKELLALGSSSN